MAEKSDVIIVSAYGRGNWLAAELQQSGTNVCFVDVTKYMGRWAPEDWEGPFGVLVSEQLEDSQKRSLDSEAPMTVNPRGLTVWGPKGPIEARGPLASHKFSQMGELEGVLDELSGPKKKNHTQLKNHWKEKPFKDSWYLNLCYNYASNCFTENIYSLENNYCPPVKGEHYIRKIDRRAYGQGLQWLKDLGVRVIEDACVADISFSSRFIQSIEVQSEWSGILTADQFVWTLSSLETRYMSETVSSKLFDQVLNPQWSWQRFRLNLTTEKLVELPEHFLFIKDPSLTWCHDNLMIFNRVNDSGLYDVWMRLPYAERFHRSYLADKVGGAIFSLRSRIDNIEVEIASMPQEDAYDEKDLGPSCMPVYDREFLTQFKTKTWINLIYDSPEQWPSLEWTGRFQFQSDIRSELLQWKKNKDDRQKKIEQELPENSP